jgi:hypothetical protein
LSCEQSRLSLFEFCLSISSKFLSLLFFMLNLDPLDLDELRLFISSLLLLLNVDTQLLANLLLLRHLDSLDFRLSCHDLDLLAGII